MRQRPYGLSGYKARVVTLTLYRKDLLPPAVHLGRECGFSRTSEETFIGRVSVSLFLFSSLPSFLFLQYVAVSDWLVNISSLTSITIQLQFFFPCDENFYELLSAAFKYAIQYYHL